MLDFLSKNLQYCKAVLEAMFYTNVSSDIVAICLPSRENATPRTKAPLAPPA